MGLGVAIEGLVNLLKFDKPKETDDLIKLKKQIAELVTNDVSFQTYKGRIEGYLSSMSTLTVADKLFKLSAEGKVTKAYIDAWKKLRNKGVHPKADLLKRPDYGKLFTHINASTALMWQLTFILIGYSGKYTDYGVIGMPLKSYPADVT